MVDRDFERGVSLDVCLMLEVPRCFELNLYR